MFGCHRAPVATTFCEIANDRSANDRLIRVSMAVLFSRHGVMMRHPDCPEVFVDWQDAPEFRGDPSYNVLLEAIRANEAAEIENPTLDGLDLLVDMTATYRWRHGHRELVVRRVHSTRPIPHVYRNELERQTERCWIGGQTTIDQAGVQEACERERALRAAPPSHE